MIQIDMKKLRETLPENGKVKLRWKQNRDNRSLFIECIVRFPSLYNQGTKQEEENLERVLQEQKNIVPKEARSEFYTEETGNHWLIYLKRVPIEFINASDEDIKSYTGYSVQQLTTK